MKSGQPSFSAGIAGDASSALFALSLLPLALLAAVG
jgi:hypothetical protein